MKVSDRRESVRINGNFPANLFKDESDCSFVGLVVNLSQTGAFVKTQSCRFFEMNEQTTATCFLPPEFTGKNSTIGLKGVAVIRRVDVENEGVAVEFVERLKEFERFFLH